MREIKGIRVFDMDDMIPMYEMKVNDVSANIHLFDNDMRYLMPNIGAVEHFIDVKEVRDMGKTKFYEFIQDGIFIHIDDIKKFMDMAKVDKIAFYAMVVGDEKLEGFGVFTGIREDEGERFEDNMLFNKFIDTENNQFWWEYESFDWNDMTFEQVRTFLTYGTIHGEKKSGEEFFEK